jgi:glycosyltransferase involved in cell wall biosynthesis
MNISFVIPDDKTAGGVRSTVRAANGLIDKGHEVRLLIKKEKLSKNSIRPVIRNLWVNIRYPGAINWLDRFKGRVLFFNEIKNINFVKDEIVVASGMGSCLEVKKLRNREIKKIHYIRGLLPANRETIKDAWDDDAARIVVANHLRETVREMCARRVDAVIPNGIDTSEYYPALHESQRDGVGTIYQRSYCKDPETILEVLRRLRLECEDVTQRVFGVSRKPKEIARSNYTRFPSVEKARDIYSRSLVWIMASRSEGLPNPVFEAMACGCAIVATDCGGSRDIVRDGENGFLTEVGNARQIVDKVKLLLDNPQLRREMVTNARKTIDKFTWENSINQLESFLKTMESEKILTNLI